MTFIYEFDPYPVKIYRRTINELPTLRLSKRIVLQTHRHTYAAVMLHHAASRVFKHDLKSKSKSFLHQNTMLKDLENHKITNCLCRQWYIQRTPTRHCALVIASCLIYARALLEYVNLIVWVRSVNKMLSSVKFAEYKVLTFFILREKC